VELYQKKLDEKVGEVESFGDQDDLDDAKMNAAIAKTKEYAAILGELNLKRKLTLKRSLNLCLILLKQCRANVNDKNLVDICVTLI
jgi:hypothetical protein